MRTKNGILNFITGYFFYFILAILGFIKVKVFLSSLGQELYALNQLYINLFSYLSLAEAGVGTAFTYRLYKLLADENYDGVNAIFSGTKLIFRRIGLIILGSGFALSFIIPFLINDNTFSNSYILVTFILFVVKNAIDYFMYVPRLVIQADQKMYKINLTVHGYRILEVIVEIILLLNGVNYILILIPSIFVRVFQNYRTNKRIYSYYPWLKTVEKKDFSNTEDIKHMIVHRVVGLISNNIDIVILSSFVGSKVVAIYASYNYLMKFAQDTTSQIFNALKDGLGNVIQVESKEKIRQILNEFIALFSFFGSLVVIVFYFVLDDFIEVWVGSEYLVSKFSLVLFLTILYYNITIRSLTIIRTAMGLFKETKTMAAIEACINLVLSLILVHYYGLNGVLIATIISFLITAFWYYPYIIYKNLFNECILKYMKKIFSSVMVILFLVYLGSYIYPIICKTSISRGLIDWFIRAGFFAILVFILLSITYLVLYKEFRGIIARIKIMFRRKKDESSTQKDSI